jgi:hypothetical protein
VLGVDDFALGKRQTNDTVLIDRQRQRPVALFPDRGAETLVQWLKAWLPGNDRLGRHYLSSPSRSMASSPLGMPPGWCYGV